MTSRVLPIRLLLLCLITALLFAVPTLLTAQNVTSGGITGTITDPSGAAVAKATVTLKNVDTGQTLTTQTNGTGAYRFSLLNPGNYDVSAASTGLQASSPQTVTVAVGQTAMLNVQLQVKGAQTTVEVTAEPGVIQTENGNVSTAISPQIIANQPNPGNDLTYYAQVAPGAVMNTQAGYGNTAFFGISGTSNLFTVDGMNENDPFLNLSNSGATNLMLGANDISTATVVTNGYSGEYGQMAGANINYVTKSGGNKFHGNAEYFWNGSILNANDWFNNNRGTPRPFDNANQWAASIGGPIIKNNTFFFVDTEGLRLLIPTAIPVNVPSPQFQAATLATIPADETSFYNRIFSIYNHAPGVSRATNSLPAGGCDGSPVTGLAPGAPCALTYNSNINNLTTEWLLTTRIDHIFSSRDRAFVHFRTDHGLQASITDPLSPVLNAQSIQPQYEGQIQENHQIGNDMINQFILAGSYYGAVFGPPSLSAAQALMPYELNFLAGQFTVPGSGFYSTWPQGRNVTQYQIEDDLAWEHGAHNFKFGVNFRRNDITDYTPGGFNTQIPTANFGTEASFEAGTVDSFVQGFAARPTEPIALYSFDLYAQDTWTVRSNLNLTLSLRAEHNSNPVCQTNCFANLSGPFFGISHNLSQPYNSAIRTGLHSALPGLQSIAWEPRLGFAWQPYGNGKTVVRGGIGIFADIFPGTIASAMDTNSPLKNTFVTTGSLAPGSAGSAQAAAIASNSAFLSGFNSGLNFSQITALVPAFSPPGFTAAEPNLKYPTYYEWNIEVEQALGTKNSISLDYVGNHGTHLSLVNTGVNAYCGAGCAGTLGVAGFAGLPAAPTDPRFSTVSDVSTPGVSNYNGLVVSFTRHVSTSFQMQANFTWSHALDDISNGGFLPFNFGTNTAVLAPQDPFNLKLYNYGNSDYDIRKAFNANYVWQTPKMHSFLLNALLDWSIAGDFFVNSGLPFTPIDGALTSGLSAYNYGPATGTSLFANDLVPGTLQCHPTDAFTIEGTARPCMTASQFTAPVNAAGIAHFGAERRNQVYGPWFFDTDMMISKNFHLPHWEGAELQIGAQAFNLLNHPNFDQPISDIANPQFGTSVRTVASPTSIFGSFLGADASPRAFQLRGTLTF